MACAMLFAAAIFGIVLTLQTRRGTLTIEMDAPDTVVQVVSDKNEVVLERPGEKGLLTIEVAPGKWRLLLRKDGEIRFSRDFSLASGDKATITIPGTEKREETKEAVSTVRWTRQQQEIDDRKARERQATFVNHLGVPVEITNSLGMKLALIPTGEFQMGSTPQMIKEEMELHGSQNWFRLRMPAEMPQHRVRITKPFRLGVTEVTQEQYEQVMGDNPSKTRGDPKLPVEQVSWDNAVEFCRRLSESPKEKAEGRVYVLPTEAQWEYACRADSTAVIQTAADPLERASEESQLAEYAWINDVRSHPVGRKCPNGFGLYDMYGNVGEWCQDWYKADYYAKSPTDDPPGPATGSTHIIRGGGWYNPPYGCRLTFREYDEPGFMHVSLGFRVVQISLVK